MVMHYYLRKLRGEVSVTFDLQYSLNGADFHVKYSATLTDVNMQFVDASGATRTEVYKRK